MKIYGFQIGLSFPGKENILALMLFLCSASQLIYGVVDTHWMVSYRMGDSIVPRETGLVREGPFLLSEVRTRNAVLAGFTDPSDGTLKYTEDICDFNISPSTSQRLINGYDGRSSAYLFVYTRNPLRQIWRIVVNGVEVMSYRKAVSDYRVETYHQYGPFWASAAFAVWFLISIIEVRCP